MKNRFDIIDDLADYYDDPNRKGIGFTGYLESRKSQPRESNLSRLKTSFPDYEEIKEATEITGGDNDYIIIDHKKKTWCWWENGFSPFNTVNKDFPHKHGLLYWAKHRK